MNANYISFLLESLGYPPPSSPSHIKIGDKVRVKASVTTPKYKWGSVTHQSVGVVKGSTTSQENSQVFSFSSTNVNSFFFFPFKGRKNKPYDLYIVFFCFSILCRAAAHLLLDRVRCINSLQHGRVHILEMGCLHKWCSKD